MPEAGSIVAVQVVGPRPGKDGAEFGGTCERQSKSGNDMLQVHAIVEPNMVGASCWLFDYILLGTDYTEQKVGALLDALGFDLSVAGYNVTPDTLIGRRGYVRIKHEEYNGETRAKIAYWISTVNFDKLGLEPLPQDEPGERRTAKPQGLAAPNVAESQSKSDDDIPF